MFSTNLPLTADISFISQSHEVCQRRKQVFCCFLLPFPPDTRLLIYHKRNVTTNRKAEAETKGFEFQCQVQCTTELIDLTQNRWSHKRHVTTLSLSVEY